jgi:hypothetical protein
VTLAGIVMLVRPMQFQNELLSIMVTVEGILYVPDLPLGLDTSFV